MLTMNPVTSLHETFSDAFFAALEIDALEPSERSLEDRIAAVRAEIAGLARYQNNCEGERNQNEQ